MRISHVVLMTSIAAIASSCACWRDENPCESVEEYQQSRIASDVQVPPGLSNPSAAGRLAIPESPVSEQALAANAACLQKPPNYFDKPVRAPPVD